MSDIPNFARGLTDKQRSVEIGLPAEVDGKSVESVRVSIERALAIALSGGLAGKVLDDADKMAKLIVGNTLPVAALVEEQSHVQRTKNLIVDETLWATGETINSQQKTPKENKSAVASDWKRRGRIFGVNDGEKEVFPAYQFDMAWQPLPIIKEILAQLGDVADSWRIAAWFHFPNAWLSYRDGNGAVVSVAPKDALDRIKDVVEAARKNRATYIA